MPLWQYIALCFVCINQEDIIRDNMTNMELVLNMFAETSSPEISKNKNSKDFKEAEDSVKRGGNVARVARGNQKKKLEEVLYLKKC